MNVNSASDDKLLVAFRSGGREGPSAFAELVARHGGMVYQSCLRILGDQGLAEDAAQAVFIVFARKAQPGRGSIESFLHKIAVYASRQVRDAERLRKEREKEAAMETARRRKMEPEAPGWEEVRPHLDEAILGLSKMQRAAAILYYLEGRKQEDVAAALGIARTSVNIHLGRAREKLRVVLSRRGIGLSVAVLAGFLAERTAEAACPPFLLAAAGKLAVSVAGAAGFSGNVALLAEGAAKMIFWAKMKMAAAIFGLAALAGAGIPVAVHVMAGEGPGEVKPPVAGNAGVKPVPPAARVYFVAVSGNDVSDGGSPERAWKTVTHAASRAAAGDTVYIKAGLYRGEKAVIRNSGTDKAPLIFQGYKVRPGETPDPKYRPGDKLNPEEFPVLDGEGGKGSGLSFGRGTLSHIVIRNVGLTRYRYGLEVGGTQSVTLENVIATDNSDNGLFVYDSTKCSLRNCIATDGGMENIWLLRTHNTVLEGCKCYGTVFEGEASTDYYIVLTDSRDNTVRDCLAHNLHAERFTEHPGKGHPGHGIGIKDRAGPKGYGQPHSTGNKIVNCIARNMGEHFFVAHEAHRNEFVNCTAISQFRARAYWSEGIEIRDGAHDNVFRECRVEGARTALAFQDTVEGPENPDGSPVTQICARNTVANCVFVDSNKGIEIWNADDNLVRNCVFDSVGEWALVRFPPSDGGRRLDHRNQGNLCRNTVVTNVTGAFQLDEKGAGDQILFTHSDFWANKFKMPAGAGNMAKDPLFADAAKRDFHLRSARGRWDKAGSRWVRDPETSPCIDAGDPADDFSAEPKPNGGRINIGAYGGTPEASQGAANGR